MDFSELFTSTTTSSDPEPSKPSENTNESQGSSWWSSPGWGILESVKEQSASILNIYKEEFTEFSKVITTDTAQMTNQYINKIQKTLNQNEGEEESNDINSNSQSQNTRNSQRRGHKTSNSYGSSEENDKGWDNNDFDESLKKGRKSPKEIVLTRYQGNLIALQSDIATYCNEPVNMDDFNQWREKKFSFEEQSNEISSLLTENSKIRTLHSKLVPKVVSYQDFWTRYFYRVFKLDEQEKRRADLLKRAQTKSPAEDEEEFSWGTEEDEDRETQNTSTNSTESTTEISAENIFTDDSKTTTPPTLDNPSEKEKGTQDIQSEEKRESEAQPPLENKLIQKLEPLAQIETPQQKHKPTELKNETTTDVNSSNQTANKINEQEPKPSTEELASVTQESTQVTQELTTVLREQTMVHQEPTSVSQESTPVDQEPASIHQEPTLVPQEPILSIQQPISQQETLNDQNDNEEKGFSQAEEPKSNITDGQDSESEEWPEWE